MEIPRMTTMDNCTNANWLAFPDSLVIGIGGINERSVKVKELLARKLNQENHLIISPC